MEGLNKKSVTMLGPRESFLLQAYLQGRGDLSAHHHVFVVPASGVPKKPQNYKATVTRSLLSASLTPRETEIMVQFGKGLSVKGIARQFDISPGTVKWHVANIYEKLEASSREDALAKARQLNLIPE